MVLVPTTIVTRRMLLNAWNGWCIVMLIIIITGVSVQDPGSTPNVDGLPPQVHKGMKMSHEAYRFESFDCNEPEDVLTQSIPHSCSVKALEGKPRDMEPEPKQEYMILQ